MSATEGKNSAVFGTLSLLSPAGAVFLGITMTLFFADQMTSFVGAIGGIGFCFKASIVSLILGSIGMFRREKPAAPAFFGTLLSTIPVIIWILMKLL